MFKLLADLTKFITSKAVLFSIILLLLVGVAWLKSKHSELENTKLKLDEISALINELEKNKQELLAQEKEWRKKFDASEAKCRLARVRLQSAAEARKTLEDLENQCGIFKRICTPVLLDEITRAKIDHATKRARYRTAKLACDVAKSELGASGIIQEEILRTQKQLDTLIPIKDEFAAYIDRSPIERLNQTVKPQVPIALVILFSIILAPYFIRITLYFVIAPFASLLRPIKMKEKSTGKIFASDSSVSVELAIEPLEKVTVRQQCLQSFSSSSKKRTQWLLNSRLPVTSLASGMYALTSLRNESKETEYATISSNIGILDQVLLITIAPGASFVIKPRNLVGFLTEPNQPVRIVSHWRVFSLHSWLTLQLRYLVIESPCVAIVKGFRGVKAEAPSPSNPRLIDHHSTIGFSANLAYSNERCETFFPYLRGAEDLFRDKFSEGEGLYIYSESPQFASGEKRSANGLEKALDIILNVFGI
jgi:hypothetical protein